MTNISPLCNELLGGHNAVQIAPSTFSLERINGFLQEAYSINARISELLSYLHTVKPSYLSTAPPPRRNAPRKPKDTQYLSNNQRDAIDAEAKSTLRDLNATINNLSQAESVRQQSETALQRKRRRKGGFGALGQWASGGGEADRTPAEKAEDARQNGVNTCRDGVVWYLQRHLESCSKVQSQMMEIRISGEIEKSRNALNLAKGATPSLDDSMLERDRRAEQTPSVPIDELDPSSAGGEQHLSQEQMQMFQQENRDMLKLYSDRLDQVRTAEKSLVEISELQSTLAANLEVQSAQIEQLVGDSLYAEENVGGGNKQLKKASERESTARMAFWATVIGCGFLIGWDLVI